MRRHAIRQVALPVLMIIVTLGVTGCTPSYPGTPRIAPYTGSTRRTVLLIGDSLMNQAAVPITASLARHGLRAIVFNRSRDGSAVAPGEFARIDWARALPAMLDSIRPDFVVAEFIGHGSDADHPIESADWAPWVEANAIRIVDEVTSRNIPIYWVVPPVSAFLCAWNNVPLTIGVFKFMADWYRSGLVASRPKVVLVDWRTPISPGETRSQSLRFGAQGIKAVRRGDCVHLSPLGARIAADATVAVIRAEWDGG